MDDAEPTSSNYLHAAQAGATGLRAEALPAAAVPDTLFALFDDDRTLLVALDENHRIVQCNRGYAAACGGEPGQLVGSRPEAWLDIHLPGWPEAEPGTSAASPAYRYAGREEWLCGQGERYTVAWLKLWAYADAGDKRYLKLGTRAHQEPGTPATGSDSRVQLKAFLDAAPDAIITIDEHGRMVSVNPATERLFGYHGSELHGNNVSMLMPAPDRERHDDYMQRYLETGTPRVIGVGRDVTARRKDGSTFPAHLSVSEFEVQGRRYFTGMLHDISDRVQAERQQREMFSEHAHVSRVVALGEMASSIAHEINQPLTAIVSYADASRKLVENNRHDPDTLNHALRQIAAQGQRAGEIIRRLREFVKKKEPRRSTVNLNDLIEAAVALTNHDADRHGITLEFELASGSFPVMVDRLQIEQVILNLVRNSIEAITDAGQPGGHIRVTSRMSDEVFVVSVSDDGPGIPAGSLGDIFNPFYTTKEKGTGLGLSISQSIAEAHGGGLSLQSNPDAGVTFTLTIPAERHD